MAATEIRRINWIENTGRSLSAQLRNIAACAPALAYSMSELLLKRLPEDIRETLVGLLPEGASHPDVRGRLDEGLHYADFLHHACETICEHCPELSGDMKNATLDSLAERAVDAFLWTVAQEFPVELKTRIAHALPVEMTSRMNLYSGWSEESKVA